MAAVVITTGALKCADQGEAVMTSTAKLTVGGTPVVLSTFLAGPTPYAGCTFPPSGTPKPCALTTPTSGGTSQKLTCGGTPVLLDDLQATTDNSSPVTLTAGETKLTAT